uniref:Orf48 n=1 Tax=Daucus carota subsp. sativus TaxID=79200 RepID=I1TIF6_DAUCS|nr:orf48 [Daucus carota subsp. sativus]AEY81186.1 orf48 [Daucus carota subsp. sativus]
MVAQCFLCLFLRIISLIFSFSSRIICIPLSRTSINGISRRIIRSAIIVAAIALIIIAIIVAAIALIIIAIIRRHEFSLKRSYISTFWWGYSQFKIFLWLRIEIGLCSNSMLKIPS